MWKILICDNDEAFLNKIKTDIMGIADIRVKQIELFHNAEQFEFYVAENCNEANIIIMDIRLDGVSGIELAQRILEMQTHSQIIFVSGYDEYYLDVYTVDHVYFLKKPIVTEHLRRAIRRVGEKLCDLHVHSFTVSNRDGIHKVPYNEILYLENERRKIHVHTIRGDITFYGKFEDLLQGLDDRFKRCHNSYIVNITKVRNLSSRKFCFDTGKAVPISQTYYDEVRKAFLQYISAEIHHDE